MQYRKGSISLIFLVILFYLAVFAQIMLYYLQKDYEHTLHYAQGIQKRTLCTALERTLVEHKGVEDNINFLYTLAPNTQTLEVLGTNTTSADTYFEHNYVRVAQGDDYQVLNRLVFHPTARLSALGHDYMFISYEGMTGTGYLTNEQPYTSGEDFTMPSLNFLSTRASTALDMSIIHDYGFPQNFYYASTNIDLTYDTTAKTTKGSVVIACTNRVTIEKNFYAPDRVIILANGTVTLEENVRLDNVLIISNGDIRINAGCKLNGVIMSHKHVRILGAGKFTHDANVVADFASAYFIA